MKKFPKHPDTQWVSLRRRMVSEWKNMLLNEPASVYGTLTFEWEPSDPESVLSLVKRYSEKQLAGKHRKVDWLAVAERGTTGDRLHSHILLWNESLLGDIQFCDEQWNYGKTEVSPYRPGGGAEVYIARKISRGEVWDCSNTLVDRLGPFMESEAA